ncbi:MAG TPA: hypothetical protein VHA37_01955, partial [Candidatus Saccharimonadales bacterium]|nr:hypothetical protein [Candidatus Saccharimonadales bacterium]
MPWTAKNATEHSKKADTPEKKKKWAKIANAALKTYKGNEGKAIATANAAMGDAFWNGGAFDAAYFVKHMSDVHSEDWGGWDPDDPDIDPDNVDPDDPDAYPDDEERMRRHRASSGDDPEDDDDDDYDPDGDWTDCDYRKPYRDARYDREWTAEQRKEAAENGEAMPGGGFPIKTKADLAKARQALGRASNRSAAIAHIKKRAKALGVTLPEGWPNDTSDAIP